MKKILEKLSKKKIIKTDLSFFKKREKFNYRDNRNKCNESIKLDPNSFIPYYLRAICNILNKNECLKDLKKALSCLEKEIRVYSYLLGFLYNKNINLYFIIQHLTLLCNIKNCFIEENIKIYGNKKASDLKIFKRTYDDIFSFNQDRNSDRKIPKYLKEYFSEIKNNGLNYVFFLYKKVP